MATKAERFRARVERSGPKKAKAPTKRRRDIDVDTAMPGVSATDRKASRATRSPSKEAAKKGGAALEVSADKPSRKSTRKSSGRAKRTSNLERLATRTATAPTARARRAKATGKAKPKPIKKPKAKAKAKR